MNTFCKYLDKFMSYAVAYTVGATNKLDTINVFKINKDSISIGPREEDTLYGCLVATNSNTLSEVKSIDAMAKSLRFKAKKSEVFLYYVKKGNHQAIYAFSFSRGAIQYIAKDLGMSIFSGKNIILALFDIFMIGRHYINKDNRIIYDQRPEVIGKQFVPWELNVVDKRFQHKIAMAADNLILKGKTFQAISAIDKDVFDPIELFREEWEGVIAIRFDFAASATIAQLRNYERIARFSDRELYNNLISYFNSPENSDVKTQVEETACVVNCYMHILEQEGQDMSSVVTSLTNILGMDFMENASMNFQLIKKTMMEKRHSVFDMVIPVQIAQSFFKTTHKKPNLKKDMFSWWVGVDITGNLIDYSIDENKSPHVIVTGSTGAGKSRQMITGLEQTIGFNKETKKAIRFDFFDVRYADVGGSVGNLAISLKETYGERVRIYPLKISSLRFSLFDIGVNKKGIADEDDLRYMTQLVNFALDAQANEIGGRSSEGGLTGGEKKRLMEIVKDMIEMNKISPRTLYEYSIEGGYEALLEELYAKGYDDSTRTTDLPDEYDFLKKPTLQEVITQINIYEKRDGYSKLEREEFVSLAKKMNSLLIYKFLSLHANEKPTNETFTYIDFDEIKDSPAEFAIIYWLLVKQWINIMKLKAKKNFKKQYDTGTVNNSHRALFFVDEAHNFFVFKSFEGLLLRAVKEFRKFGGVFFFMSQEMSDIPENVVSQMGTSVFVVAPKDKKKLPDIVKKYYGEMHKDEKAIIEALDDYMMFIKSDNGVSGLKYQVDPKYEWFYKPNHPDFHKKEKDDDEIS